MSATPRLKSLLDAVAADLSRPTRIAGREALGRRVQRALEPLRPAECPPYGSLTAARGHGEYLTHVCWALERPDESGYVGLALSVECSSEPTRDGLLTALYPALDVHAERRILVATVPARGLADATLTHHVLKDVRRLVARHRGMPAKARLGLVLREPSGGRVACWIVRGDGKAKPYLPRPTGAGAARTDDGSPKAAGPGSGAAGADHARAHHIGAGDAPGRASGADAGADTTHGPSGSSTVGTARAGARSAARPAPGRLVPPPARPVVTPTERVVSADASAATGPSTRRGPARGR